MLLIDIYTGDVLNVGNIQGQDEREIKIRVYYVTPPPLRYHCFLAPGTARHLRQLRATSQPHPIAVAFNTTLTEWQDETVFITTGRVYACP